MNLSLIYTLEMLVGVTLKQST